MTEEMTIFEDITNRTGGNIYISAVGPVRTGKSTFIKKFMDLIVLPRISDEYDRARTTDALPQSGAGKTIMTTELKFVPDEAISIEVKEGISAKIRLVDCVGYAVEGALGFKEANGPRMVRTPWYDHPIAFEEAAEIGTRKVITDYSTMGILVTTDGSITDLPREAYVAAEERAVGELQELNKPFIVVLNTTHPDDEETVSLAGELEEKYRVPVMPTDVAELDEEGIMGILEEILFEFPVSEVNIGLPRWVEELDYDHWLRAKFEDAVHAAISQVKRLRDIDSSIETLAAYDFVKDIVLESMDLSSGIASIEMSAADDLFYKVYQEVSGVRAEGLHDILSSTKVFAHAKKEYDKLEQALNDAHEKGYGMVVPTIEEMQLEEPEVTKKSGIYGVKLKASAPTLHIIRSDITSELVPMMGSEKQCEDLADFMRAKFAEDPMQVWQYDIFGKQLYELVRENMESKLQKMPENVQRKLRETVRRITNDGSGGLICIII